MPTFWTNSAGKYYYPQKFEVASEAVSALTDTWDEQEGQGVITLKHKTMEITADLSYTCKVSVTSPTVSVISKVATLDYITVSAASDKVHVLNGEDLTLTVTFSNLGADYSSDVLWTIGGERNIYQTKNIPNIIFKLNIVILTKSVSKYVLLREELQEVVH